MEAKIRQITLKHCLWESKSVQTLCWFKGLPGKTKIGPFMEGMGRPKKDAGHSRFVGGSFNQQGNLHTRLVLDGHKTNRSPHRPDRILKFIMRP